MVIYAAIELHYRGDRYLQLYTRIDRYRFRYLVQCLPDLSI